jgi:hypothetical protein
MAGASGPAGPAGATGPTGPIWGIFAGNSDGTQVVPGQSSFFYGSATNSLAMSSTLGNGDFAVGETESVSNLSVALSTAPVIVRGEDFPVVWVAREEEWEAAQAEGREPNAVPWPADDVRLV